LQLRDQAHNSADKRNVRGHAKAKGARARVTVPSSTWAMTMGRCRSSDCQMLHFLAITRPANRNPTTC